ncbi:MAG: hypothetical protein LQ350_000932 [Teloschistes chrysophthalmus]|nr:MAG: hypothetical protein LQ350_000932 [Niorma chrysophthalma]
MDKIFADALKNTKSQAQTTEQQDGGEAPEKYPKGVVLGKDGKPCRTCTSSADWAAMMKKAVGKDGSKTTTEKSTPPSVSTSSLDPPSECPPDVEELGRNTWTLLHTMSASYPSRASPTQQSEMRRFLGLFGRLYPCWVCAEDFQEWMTRKGNEPRLEGRDRFGRWMCEAHNEVNRKLGKQEFDCGKWEERWRTGWKDGRCD